MLKQSLLLTKPYYLSCKHSQLLLQSKHEDTDSTQHVPIEDIGMIIIDNKEISLSTTLMYELISHNCVIVLCNEKHMPVGMTTTMEAHHLHNAITHMQIDVSQPRKKQIWKQIVAQKITNQAILLKQLHKEYKEIFFCTQRVKSGDTSNMEAQAAKLYWSHLFLELPDFMRTRDGKYPNNLLNYAYAVLRAACSRALVGSGLSCTLGIHHHNKYNAYCLADDMMEPYRPFVDKIVYKIVSEHNFQEQELNSEIKLRLVEAMYQDVRIGEKFHPLVNALTLSSASLVRSFELGEDNLRLPEFG